MPTRVLLVDDHPFVRKGLAFVIEREPDLEVVGEAEDAAEALALAEATRPDVVLLDLTLRHSSGFDLLRDLRERLPETVVLVLSGASEEVYAERLLRAGASGFLSKSEAIPIVVGAIRRVMAGGTYVSEAVSARLLDRLRRGQGPVATAAGLTDRELQVFHLLGEGMPVTEIAGRLVVSAKTVESHLERIRKKMDLRTGRDVLREAILWADRVSPDARPPDDFP